MLADNRKAWELQSDGSFIQRKPQKREVALCTHDIFMEMAKQSTGMNSN